MLIHRMAEVLGGRDYQRIVQCVGDVEKLPFPADEHLVQARPDKLLPLSKDYWLVQNLGEEVQQLVYEASERHVVFP